MEKSKDLAFENNGAQARSYSQFFEKLSAVSFLMTVFLLPVFTLFNNVTLGTETAKHFLLAVGVPFSLFFLFIARFESGSLELPRHPLYLAAYAVIASAVVATIFSPSVRQSLIGVGTENGTLVSILTMFALLGLAAFHFKRERNLFAFYTGLGLCAIFLFVLQIGHLFFHLSFGILSPAVIDNVLGTWNDLALFFGFVSALATTALSLFILTPLAQRLISGVLAISLIMMFLINFSTAWILLAAVAACLFFVVYVNERRTHKTAWLTAKSDFKKFLSVAVFLIASAAALANDPLNSAILTPLGIGSAQVRPSWTSTYQVALQNLGAHPFLGAGLNRFANAWQMYKPAGVNETIFWTTDFNVGVGYIPTFAITMGGLGIIAWLLFLGLLFTFIIRTLFSKRGTPFSTLTALALVYLWLSVLLYIPTTVMLSVAFVVTGIFFAQLKPSTERFADEDLFADHASERTRLAALAIVVLALLDLGAGYLLVKRYRSLVAYQNAVYAYSLANDPLAASQSLSGAVALDSGVDAYYRSLTDADLIVLQAIVAQKKVSPDVLRNQFRTVASDAIANATRANELNPADYQNWAYLGRAYAALVPFKVQGAYNLAAQAYARALSLNPYDPEIYYIISDLEIANNNPSQARNALDKAVALKSNYTDALFRLSQLDYAQGNLKSAISNASRVAALAPQNVGAFFQLGVLDYLAFDYNHAITALENAVNLQPHYANAQYFLGLSYSMVGENAKAIKVFEDIALSNPDNVEVKTILGNLRLGAPALAGVGAPANQPAVRPHLPVREKSGTAKRP